MDLNISVSGMSAAARRLAVTANNIANVNTPGYRAIHAQAVAARNGGVRVETVPRDALPAPAEWTSPPAGMDLLEPGLRPGSNVDLATEEVNTLLDAQAFQANVNALRAQETMLGELFDLQR